MIFAFTLVLLYDYAAIQLIITAYLNLSMILYLGLYRPFKEAKDVFLEVVNEVFVQLITILLFSYALVNDSYTMNLVTWTIIAIVFLLIAFNYAVIAHALIKSIINYLKER